MCGHHAGSDSNKTSRATPDQPNLLMVATILNLSHAQLVDVLLTPLLTEGASDVVFDTLSYSAGPLPEQLLQASHISP